MQNLASVEKVLKIEPIEGADFIQKATVLGWELVIKKGEFKEGDFAGYIQIDTVVPESEQFEFLRERKFRVRTIKLRKQISQGLLVPLPAGNWKEGDDITEVLGLKSIQRMWNLLKIGQPSLKFGIEEYGIRSNISIWLRYFPDLKPLTAPDSPLN